MLSKQERKALLQAYNNYVGGRFNELSNFVVLVVGFCLATLSSSRIPDLANLIIIVLVLITFFFLMNKERNVPESELNKKLNSLRKKYKNKQDNQEALEEIDSYDVWNSFSPRAVKTNLPILFGVLFCIYTALDHAANTFNFW